MAHKMGKLKITLGDERLEGETRERKGDKKKERENEENKQIKKFNEMKNIDGYVLLLSACLNVLQSVNPWWGVYFNNYLFHLWQMSFCSSQQQMSSCSLSVSAEGHEEKHYNILMYYMSNIFKLEKQFVEEYLQNFVENNVPKIKNNENLHSSTLAEKKDDVVMSNFTNKNEVENEKEKKKEAKSFNGNKNEERHEVFEENKKNNASYDHCIQFNNKSAQNEDDNICSFLVPRAILKEGKCKKDLDEYVEQYMKKLCFTDVWRIFSSLDIFRQSLDASFLPLYTQNFT